MLSELQRSKFTRLFHCIDSNNDGVWEPSDFERIADRLARGFIPAAPLDSYQALGNFWQAQWQAVYTAVPARQMERISLTEWLQLNEQLAIQPRRTVRRILKQFGVLRRLLEPAGAQRPCTARQIAIWFSCLNYDLRFAPLALRTLDTDGDGVLVQAELIQRGIEWLGSDPTAPGNWLLGPQDAPEFSPTFLSAPFT
jgi:hypothetical protein